MADSDYRTAYHTAATELESLLKEQTRIDERILALRKTMNILSTLIQQSADGSKGTEDYRFGRVEQLIQGTLTEDIRKIMAASPDPLTTSDVRDELNKLGNTMAEQSNPLATINAILNRLHEQGTAVETLKNGRKAWKRHPVPQFLRNLSGTSAGRSRSVGERVLRGLRAKQSGETKK
ncbi:MAG: hypothetical protein ACHP8B_00690 [Terriglobales bacterium]